MRPFLLLAAVLAACAHAPAQPSAEAEEIKELRTQLTAQSALVAQQQRRIEELEVKLAALAARSEQQAAPPKKAETPPHNAPRASIKRLGAGRRCGRDRTNPWALAAQFPATVQLREPDDDALSRLDTDPQVAKEFDADHAWAVAVQKLNAGEHGEAETD